MDLPSYRPTGTVARRHERSQPRSGKLLHGVWRWRREAGRFNGRTVNLLLQSRRDDDLETRGREQFIRDGPSLGVKRRNGQRLKSGRSRHSFGRTEDLQKRHTTGRTGVWCHLTPVSVVVLFQRSKSNFIVFCQAMQFGKRSSWQISERQEFRPGLGHPSPSVERSRGRNSSIVGYTADNLWIPRT